MYVIGMLFILLVSLSTCLLGQQFSSYDDILDDNLNGLKDKIDKEQILNQFSSIFSEIPNSDLIIGNVVNGLSQTKHTNGFNTGVYLASTVFVAFQEYKVLKNVSEQLNHADIATKESKVSLTNISLQISYVKTRLYHNIENLGNAFNEQDESLRKYVLELIKIEISQIVLHLKQINGALHSIKIKLDNKIESLGQIAHNQKARAYGNFAFAGMGAISGYASFGSEPLWLTAIKVTLTAIHTYQGVRNVQNYYGSHKRIDAMKECLSEAYFLHQNLVKIYEKFICLDEKRQDFLRNNIPEDTLAKYSFSNQKTHTVVC